MALVLVQHGLPATPHVQQSSPDTTTVKTFDPPQYAVACIITVETTAARVTFDGSTPASDNGQVFPISAVPVYVPLGKTIKHTSTAGTASVLNVLWLS
jgi:hypothetical protein